MKPPDERSTPRARRWPRRVAIFVGIPLAVIVAAALLAFQLGGTPYKMPSGGMEATLRCGDRIYAEQLTSRSSHPRRGDVVAFHPPAGRGEDGRPDQLVVANADDARRSDDGSKTVVPADTTYVKRVVGLPGERVEVEDHEVIVDGDELDEPYTYFDEEVAGMDAGGNADWGPLEVPDGTYLLLGDHRDNSADGRVFGFVPREFIEGRVVWVYWPPSRVGRLPAKADRSYLDDGPDPNCLEFTVPAGQELTTP